MKNLKYIFIFLLACLFFSACEEETREVYQISDGDNLVAFADNSTSFGFVADGREYDIDVKVGLTGPSVENVSGDIEVTFSVDTSSTAQEGVHYVLPEGTFILSESDDYLGVFSLKMITEGIVTPLAESPVIVLNIAGASGSTDVIASGKSIEITLDYACNSSLAGMYDLVCTNEDGDMYTATEEINDADGLGMYWTTTATTKSWNADGGGYGVYFKDVCGTITVPSHILLNYYGNNVFGHSNGSVDENGVITIHYTVEFSAGNVKYTSVYTPVP